MIHQRSRSGRVYLVSSDTFADPLPRVGKVLLAKKSDRPHMGLRVLKAYEDTRRFAVKKIKEYQPGTFLIRGTFVDSIEKVGDGSEDNIPPTTPLERAQDARDLRELEGGAAAGAGADGPLPPEPQPDLPSEPQPNLPSPDVQGFDPELDAGVTPLADPMGSAEDDLSELEDIVVRESVTLDPESRWFSLNLSFMRSGRADGSSPYYLSGGLAYGFDLSKRIFFNDNRAQDSITFEGALHYYQVSDTASYTVMPTGFTLRYNVFTSENLGFFGYGGLSKNWVVAASDDYDDLEIDALDDFVPAFGVGLLFKVGPQWMARVDLGFDQIGVGLVLRF